MTPRAAGEIATAKERAVTERLIGPSGTDGALSEANVLAIEVMLGP